MGSDIDDILAPHEALIGGAPNLPGGPNQTLGAGLSNLQNLLSAREHAANVAREAAPVNKADETPSQAIASAHRAANPGLTPRRYSYFADESLLTVSG